MSKMKMRKKYVALGKGGRSICAVYAGSLSEARRLISAALSRSGRGLSRRLWETGGRAIKGPIIVSYGLDAKYKLWYISKGGREMLRSSGRDVGALVALVNDECPDDACITISEQRVVWDNHSGWTYDNAP